MRYLLITLCVGGVLVVACGASENAGTEKDSPLQDAVVAAAATQEADDAKDIARLGEARELAFYPNGDFESEPENMLVTVLSFTIETLSPAPGLSDPRPTLVLKVLIENPTNSTGGRPAFEIITSNGESVAISVGGDYEGPRDLVSIFELPPKTQLEGAFFVDLESAAAPPTSLTGWRIVATPTRIVPPENNRAVWLIE